VLRTSAIMDERETGEWRPGVVSPIANIPYRLLEAPRGSKLARSD